MQHDDIEYFMFRARQERDRAEQSTDAALRRVHLEFAAHYEARLREPLARPKLRIV
ncbi:hypothetical protein [Sphingomonas sp.]|uniref:hypothetical protein n=1 Tax=Sphingomonas sp. TaxID=28214 RepID=UPI002DD6BA0C|nr:hypothetical protein [Sphingomonas sp.]